ncbi:MAG: hypothetical protein FWG87_03775 [Defluviitaleaceae bacterium]|nr:hypothetical protein [Defluviitaleaceae bacterium]
MVCGVRIFKGMERGILRHGTRIFADYADFVHVNLLDGDIFSHERIR